MMIFKKQNMYVFIVCNKTGLVRFASHFMLEMNFKSNSTLQNQFECA